MGDRTPEEEETLALMAEIWAEFRGEHLERLVVLEQAAGSLRAGALTGDLRLRAKQEAHKLAGSVGTFGFAEASRLAREIERLLEGSGSQEPRGQRMTSLQQVKLQGSPTGVRGSAAGWNVSQNPCRE